MLCSAQPSSMAALNLFGADFVAHHHDYISRDRINTTAKSQLNIQS
jgi:hypothetical protein